MANEVQEEIKFIITDPEDYISVRNWAVRRKTDRRVVSTFSVHLLGALSTFISKQNLRRNRFWKDTLSRLNVCL